MEATESMNSWELRAFFGVEELVVVAVLFWGRLELASSLWFGLGFEATGVLSSFAIAKEPTKKTESSRGR